MNRICHAVLAVAFLAALTGPRTASAIWNGSLTSDYEAVGGIAAVSGDYVQVFGSGTLIADRWILTAGHVANLASGSYFIYGENNALGIVNAYAHPAYDSGASEYDLGLLELEGPVSGASLPTLFNGDFTGTAVAGYLGQAATLVGYGADDPRFMTGAGERREGGNSISFVDASLLGFRARDGAGLLAGDSGGSTWADFGLGEVLIGVHSFIVPNRDDLYDSYDLRIDTASFRSWIDGTIGEGSVRWANGTAIASVPEPASLSILVSGLTVLAFTRRHRRRRD